VIEAGGVKNVTNNYYTQEEQQKAAKDVVVHEGELPEVLLTEEAETIWHDLREAGFIVPDGYGLAEGVSANQATYIADRMAEKLSIVKRKWKVFGQLWGIRNMAQLAGSWQQTGKLPPKSKEIDKLI
jgi:hypothetical protein